jgi:hypothetical protein
MVSCDLCGASPTSADASPAGMEASPTGADASVTSAHLSPAGADAVAAAHAPVQRQHQAPARTDARGDADDSPKDARADAGTDADGGAEADGTVPLGWVISVEAGRTRTYCEACARAHLRSIEAKLDSDWW